MTSSSATSHIDELVASCADIATRLARRYTIGPGVDGDLEQAAMVGIVAAATRYDAGVGPFRPYATATALGELKKHLRSNGWVVGVPRRVQEATAVVAQANEALEQELGTSPTPAQVAERTGLSVEDVLLALRAHNGRFATHRPLAEPTAVSQSSIQPEELLDLRSAASHLSPEDLEMLRMRFVEEMTQREIADRVGVSQPQIYRRLSRALEQLRALLEPPDDDVGT